MVLQELTRIAAVGVAPQRLSPLSGGR
jgi:hypothetical protein